MHTESAHKKCTQKVHLPLVLRVYVQNVKQKFCKLVNPKYTATRCFFSPKKLFTNKYNSTGSSCPTNMCDVNTCRLLSRARRHMTALMGCSCLGNG